MNTNTPRLSTEVKIHFHSLLAKFSLIIDERFFIVKLKYRYFQNTDIKSRSLKTMSSVLANDELINVRKI